MFSKAKAFLFQASRATFQHKALDNATIRNRAMNSVKGAMNDVQFDDSDSDFHSPIPYTAMYVQWEANKVRKGYIYPFI